MVDNVHSTYMELDDRRELDMVCRLEHALDSESS